MPTAPISRIHVDSRRVVGTLVIAAGLLAALHLVAAALARSTIHGSVPGATTWVRIFNLDAESTVGTWWASASLAAAAVVALLLSRLDDVSLRRGWVAATVVLAFLSLDEAAGLHEGLSAPVVSRLDLEPERWFLWAWLLPYSIALVVLLVVAVPFLRRLPAPTPAMLLLGLGTFVTGAAVMELVGRELIVPGPGHEPAGYVFAVMFEETLELLGVAIVLHALLERHRTVAPTLSVEVGQRAPSQ